MTCSSASHLSRECVRDQQIILELRGGGGGAGELKGQLEGKISLPIGPK